MNRAEALAAALAQAGYSCTVAGRRVLVQAPAFTRAHVRLDESGFACVFDANELFASKRGACVAWADWTRKLETATGVHSPPLAHLPLPAEVALESAPTPAPVDLSSCMDAYASGPCVPDACRYAMDEIRAQRFAVFACHVAPAWSSMDSSDLEWQGAAIGWHAWAEPVAVELGAARGWAKIAGDTIDDSHPASTPVERVLLEAAEKLPAPAGLGALDLRGLAPRLAAKLVTALVCAARERAATRGAIVLVDAHTRALLTRTVDLDCSAPRNDAQGAFAWD